MLDTKDPERDQADLIRLWIAVDIVKLLYCAAPRVAGAAQLSCCLKDSLGMAGVRDKAMGFTSTVCKYEG